MPKGWKVPGSGRRKNPNGPKRKPSSERVNEPGYKAGGSSGHGFKPGQSGNPSGRPKKFTTILSEALKESLAEMHPTQKDTYASVIARGMVAGASKLAEKKKLTKELIGFLKEARDTTEGKPPQRVEFSDITDAEPTERISELLARAIERASGASHS